MVYNFTGLENNTNILDFFIVVNSASNELFMSLIMIVLWVVLFIAFKDFDTVTALQSSFFIVGIIGVLGNIVGLISPSIMMIPLVATGLTVLYGIIRND